MIGYVDSCKSPRVQECTRELFREVIRGERVKKLCEAIARAHEQWQAGEIEEEAFKAVKDANKRKLPGFTFQAVFPGGQRKNTEAVPTGFAMLDIDGMAHPREFYHDRVEPRLAELGIILAHVTPSISGLRLVFLRLPGMDLAQAQAWMAHELGVKEEYDKAVKDLARISFAVPEEYILFIDEEKLFSNEEPLEMKNEELRMKNLF